MRWTPHARLSLALIVLALPPIASEAQEYNSTNGTIILFGTVIDGKEFQIRIDENKLFGNDVLLWEIPLEQQTCIDTTGVRRSNFTTHGHNLFWRAMRQGEDANAAIEDFMSGLDFVDHFERTTPRGCNIYFEDGDWFALTIGEDGPRQSAPTLVRIQNQLDSFANGVVKALGEGSAVVISPARRYPCQPEIRFYSAEKHDDVLRDVIRVLQGRGEPEILDEQTVRKLKSG